MFGTGERLDVVVREQPFGQKKLRRFREPLLDQPNVRRSVLGVPIQNDGQFDDRTGTHGGFVKTRLGNRLVLKSQAVDARHRKVEIKPTLGIRGQSDGLAVVRAQHFCVDDRTSIVGADCSSNGRATKLRLALNSYRGNERKQKPQSTLNCHDNIVGGTEITVGKSLTYSIAAPFGGSNR